jgi:hypothetical protein
MQVDRIRTWNSVKKDKHRTAQKFWHIARLGSGIGSHWLVFGGKIDCCTTELAKKKAYEGGVGCVK